MSILKRDLLFKLLGLYSEFIDNYDILFKDRIKIFFNKDEFNLGYTF